jgi:putative aldouronate transport system permease protein
MAVSILGVYGLSRPGSLGHRYFLMTIMATMFFGAGLIPTYLLVQALGLTDTCLSLILPSAVSVFNVLVLRAFFTSTPAPTAA